MEKIDDSVRSIAALLHDPGVLFEYGCAECDAEKFVNSAKEKYPDKSFCVAKKWVIWDVQVSDKQRKIFEALSLEPIVVHVDFVIEDEFGRANYGNFRISTPLVEMSEPCFFVTRNTVYILVGEGTRKAAAEQDVIALFR